jgi:hypothetical protein
MQVGQPDADPRTHAVACKDKALQVERGADGFDCAGEAVDREPALDPRAALAEAAVFCECG